MDDRPQKGDLNLCVGISFPDQLLTPHDFLWSNSSTVKPSLDAIEQLKPIFQRWILQRFPRIKSFVSPVEMPSIPHPVCVDLDLLPFFCSTFPADFSLRHSVFQLPSRSGRSRLATAMAAMPSPRPTKPMVSFVVAFKPTRSTLMLNACAMLRFMSLENG